MITQAAAMNSNGMYDVGSFSDNWKSTLVIKPSSIIVVKFWVVYPGFEAVAVYVPTGILGIVNSPIAIFTWLL